ncbi:MAG: ATP-binding protein [Terriglobales bacterium]
MNAAARLRRLEQAENVYRRLLERHAASPGEETLGAAYELGRELLAAGTSLLELSQLHHRTLAAWTSQAGAGTPGSAAPGPAPQIAVAGQLFRELLAGYEMLLRGFGDANAALRNTNERMEQQVERIAHALHDESSQLVAAVMIRLDQAAAALPPACGSELTAVRRMLDQLEFQLRRVAHELHPALLTDLGLRPALEFLADGVSARTGLLIAIEGELPQRLPAPVELCLYRCVQECLNNIVRHAQARRVRIQIFSGDSGLEIRVGDDGRGFAPQLLHTAGEPHGMGLAGIRERLRGVGGELQIHAQPGAGAELRLQVPGWPEGGPHAGAAAAGR